MKTMASAKHSIGAAHYSLGGGVCAAAVLLTGFCASGQNLFVSNDGGGNLYEFTPNGTQIATITSLDGPNGLAFDGAGDLFVANGGNGTVTEITTGGSQITLASGLDNPQGLALNSAGDVFVASGIDNIIEITLGGVQSNFASGLDRPEGLVFNKSGDLFEADQYSGNIYEFTPAGVRSTYASGLVGPWGLAFDSAGNLFVANSGNGSITKISPGGGQSTFATGLSFPNELAFDEEGDLFVADGAANNVYEFTPGGAQSTFASDLNNPVGLAFQVPEPSTFALLVLSAGILLLIRQNGCFPQGRRGAKPLTRYREVKGVMVIIFVTSALCVMAQVPVTNGLVAYYPFNGNVNDASGSGNNGTIFGYDWHFGSDRFGQENALYLNTTSAPSCCFDGTYISAARPAALDFSADFTLSVWVNMPSNTPVDYPLTFISNGPDQPVGAATNGANLRITAGDGTIDGLQFIYNHEDGEVYINVQTIRDAWWQATVVRSGTSLTVFRNGSQLTNVVMTSVMPNSPEIWIGRMICPGYPTNCPGSYCMVGGIDDVLMYNRALSTNEVQQLYHQGFYQSPPQIVSQPKDQVGYWGFGASLSVRAQGSQPLSYQWLIDGFPISWGTNATLDLTNLDFSDAGTYEVEITNLYGSVLSESATLIVNPAGVSLGLYPGLTITGAVGKTFGIQYSTNLALSNGWATLSSLTLTQSAQLWFDTNATVGAIPQRFYRVVAIP